MKPEAIGWLASAVLVLTLARQVYTQWQSKEAQGVSRWLFIGQMTASIGFAIYSWLLKNWVFLFSNIILIVTAIVGELLFLRNKQPVATD